MSREGPIPETAQDRRSALLKCRKAIAQVPAFKILREMILEIRADADQPRTDCRGHRAALVEIPGLEQILNPGQILKPPHPSFTEMDRCGVMTEDLRSRNRRNRLLQKLRRIARIV
jgi:hypothetical protein